MREIELLRREIRRNIKVVSHDHIPYSGYNKKLLIKNCKGKLLRKYFKKWENERFAIYGIYNLSKILKTPQEIVDQLNKAEENFKNRKSYWVDGEEYYASNNILYNVDDFHVYGIFTECAVSIYPREEVERLISNGEKKERFVALSKIREFKLDAPNQNFWIEPFFWNCFPDSLKRKYYKEGIFIKPSRKYEWFMFI